MYKTARLPEQQENVPLGYTQFRVQNHTYGMDTYAIRIPVHNYKVLHLVNITNQTIGFRVHTHQYSDIVNVPIWQNVIIYDDCAPSF